MKEQKKNQNQNQLPAVFSPEKAGELRLNEKNGYAQHTHHLHVVRHEHGQQTIIQHTTSASTVGLDKNTTKAAIAIAAIAGVTALLMVLIPFLNHSRERQEWFEKNCIANGGKVTSVRDVNPKEVPPGSSSYGGNVCLKKQA